MKGCRAYDDSIERMLADEIGNAERDRLLAHAQDCGACREFVDLHFQLQDPAMTVELPSDAEFAMARRAVLGRIRLGRDSEQVSGLAGLRAFFTSLVRSPAYAGALAALLVVALAAGVVIGRGSGARVLAFDPTVPLEVDPMLGQIGEIARASQELSDVEDSPFVYSNVGFRDMGDGGVSVSFDVTRHVEVARRIDDPLVTEVLTQTLINGDQVGTRLQAIDYAEQLIDPKVKQALIFSMLGDSNMAVRLHALKILSRYEPDDEVQEAFLGVLAGEEAVQMRLLAMDYLATSGLSSERFDEVFDELVRRDDQALLVRAARYDLDRQGDGR